MWAEGITDILFFARLATIPDNGRRRLLVLLVRNLDALGLDLELISGRENKTYHVAMLSLVSIVELLANGDDSIFAGVPLATVS